MPSTYAHYRFSRAVLNNLPKETAEIIKSNIDLFDMGIHGPDLLFYYHPLQVNPINQRGYAMHDEAALDFFAPAGEVIEQNDYSPAHLAYIYGFICHFALDRSCHKYIDEKIAESGVTHAEIEVEFDRRLLLHDGYNPVTKCLTEHIQPSIHSAEVIADFFPTVTAEQIYKAERSFVYYNSLLLAPSPIKRGVIYSLLRVSGNYREMHGLMVNYKPNPKCKDSNKILMRHYTDGVKDAIYLINHYLDNVIGNLEWSGLYDYTFGARHTERSSNEL